MPLDEERVDDGLTLVGSALTVGRPAVDSGNLVVTDGDLVVDSGTPVVTNDTWWWANCGMLVVTGGVVILDTEEEAGKRDGITVLELQELVRLEKDEETATVEGGRVEILMVDGRGDERGAE